MSSSLSTEAHAVAPFVCGSAAWMHTACKELKEYEGTGYCVLHYPNKDKVTAFNKALKIKRDAQDFDFSGVWFPDEVNFSHSKFTTAASFHSATFSAKADFSSATFTEVAVFLSAIFRAVADFGSATFGAEAYFRSVKFNAETYFSAAKFGAEVYFNHAVFKALADFGSVTFMKRASFSYAVFYDYVRFAGGRDIFAGNEDNKVFGDNASLSLHLVKIEKPDRLSFHTLRLRPHWFVNVNARRFEFINVDWNWQGISIKQEINNINGEDAASKYRLLAIACQNLAVNTEDNNRYEEASRFRYMAMDARRLERWRGFAFWTLGWWYWLASGYGERVWRAFVVLIGIWLIAAALYTRVGFVRWEPRVSTQQEAAEARRDEVGEPLGWRRALTYSLGVMALQKPEPRPATNAAQTFVMLETILGPVQAALLALAIRRKFMR
jgi:hypothetical protein